jgi:hypothetical protein
MAVNHDSIRAIREPTDIARPSVVVRTGFFADSRSLSLAAKYTCAFQWQFGAARWEV